MEAFSGKLFESVAALGRVWGTPTFLTTLATGDFCAVGRPRGSQCAVLGLQEALEALEVRSSVADSAAAHAIQLVEAQVPHGSSTIVAVAPTVPVVVASVGSRSEITRNRKAIARNRSQNQ